MTIDQTERARIPCINPSCRRTAPREKFPDAEAVICGRCFRALPGNMRAYHRLLERRSRRLARLIERRVARGDPPPPEVGRYTARKLEESWERIAAYYLAPKGPVGLDAFIEEMGW